MNIRELLLRHRWRIAGGLVVLGLLTWYAVLHRSDWSRESLVAYGRSMHAGWFVLLYLVLPLFGLPVNVFLFLAGVRFGFAGGMLFAAAGISFHNFAAHHLANSFLRRKVRHWLARHQHKVPTVQSDNQVVFTAIFTAVQGPPYSLKLYLLALTDIPFRIVFAVSVPIYVLFSAVSVGAGSSVANFNPLYIYAVVAGALLISLLVRWLGKRAKRQKA